MTQAQPENPEAWTSYGIALYGAGRATESMEALHHSLALRPGEPRAALFLALSEADAQQCEQAVPELKRKFDGGGTDKLTRLAGLSLMSCLGTGKDTSQAVVVASDLQHRFADDPDVLYEAAELYTRLWTRTAAELMAKHPESFRVHQLAAEVYDAQGNYDQAIREYQTALQEQPRLPDAHFRLGQIYLRKGGDEANSKATAEFRTELARNPQSALSSLALAEIERHDNNLEAAGADYRRALATRPELPEARVGLARVLLAQHKVEDAKSELAQVIRANPDNAQAHYALMLAYREQGQSQQAAAEMVTFRTLEAHSRSQFQDNLGALLTGSKAAGSPPSGDPK